jgi:outer membrane protein TolC
MLRLFQEDILPRARQTLQVSSQAYSVGEVDFLQLLDNWRQALRYEVQYHRLEASLRQSLAELERLVGGFRSWDAGPVSEQGTAAPIAPLPRPR